MLAPVLATKLYAPRPRSRVVVRPRLIERLEEGSRGALIVISAPAGFGKTTVISEWIARRTPRGPDVPTAWLSLTEGDGDLDRFLTYLVAAVRTVRPDVGDEVSAMLRASRRPPTEAMLTSLLNEIAAQPHEVVLVLDDYHVIDSEAVDRALEFLVEHEPPQLHLVIAGRSEPRLPLARWRARGLVTELRAADLRFTRPEAEEFLTAAMGLHLGRDDVAVLESRTEGWIAGLQLAALSLQQRPDAADAVRSFAGSHRFVFDYLVEEVLRRRPEPERTFLLQTAVLDRMSGALCDAVTGLRDGREMLERLERANLFVVPLDDRRQWYRYHHLFADVLRTRLRAEHPDQIPALHRRASDWFEENGFRSDAIHHALAAEDVDRAAELVERAGPVVEDLSQAALWLRYATALPDALVRARPALNVWYAYALLGRGDLEGADARLTDAEHRLEAPPSPGAPDDASPAGADDQRRDLLATISIARGYHAQALGDVAATVRHARRVLELVPGCASPRRDQAQALMGMACWAGGDLEAVDRIFTDYTGRLLAVGNLPDAISAACVLADVRPVLGRLRGAVDAIVQLLKAVTDPGRPVPPDTADLHRALGELHLMRRDLAAAVQHLSQSQRLGERGDLPVWRYRWRIAQARLHEIEGDLDSALGRLDEAERLFIRTPMPDVRPIGALRTRIWIEQGRLDEALAWARRRNLTVDDDLDHRLEFDHLTLARLLLARRERDGVHGAIADAVTLLERLRHAAEKNARIGSLIEILVLQARCHQAAGVTSSAVAALERAISLAQPEGYVQVFADQGSPMADLLRCVASRTTAPDGARDLLAALLPTTAPTDARPAPTGRPLLEPLSPRELEVLQLLAAGLSNQEIANRLYVSLYTVKAHVRTIYDKLDAHSRTRAVARAQELGILPGTDPRVWSRR